MAYTMERITTGPTESEAVTRTPSRKSRMCVLFRGGPDIDIIGFYCPVRGSQSDNRVFSTRKD